MQSNQPFKPHSFDREFNFKFKIQLEINDYLGMEDTRGSGVSIWSSNFNQGMKAFFII